MRLHGSSFIHSHDCLLASLRALPFVRCVVCILARLVVCASAVRLCTAWQLFAWLVCAPAQFVCALHGSCSCGLFACQRSSPVYRMAAAHAACLHDLSAQLVCAAYLRASAACCLRQRSSFVNRAAVACTVHLHACQVHPPILLYNPFIRTNTSFSVSTFERLAAHTLVPVQDFTQLVRLCIYTTRCPRAFASAQTHLK